MTPGAAILLKLISAATSSSASLQPAIVTSSSSSNTKTSTHNKINDLVEVNIPSPPTAVSLEQFHNFNHIPFSVTSDLHDITNIPSTMTLHSPIPGRAPALVKLPSTSEAATASSTRPDYTAAQLRGGGGDATV
eukprot:GHVS01013029.1.p1 GENE.GHVS01013029.1~~GHVS01013029.1.p1  ORF type:complete len:134 (-),score=32.58 GHVS01013029.1:291-692(-)